MKRKISNIKLIMAPPTQASISTMTAEDFVWTTLGVAVREGKAKHPTKAASPLGIFKLCQETQVNESYLRDLTYDLVSKQLGSHEPSATGRYLLERLSNASMVFALANALVVSLGGGKASMQTVDDLEVDIDMPIGDFINTEAPTFLNLIQLEEKRNSYLRELRLTASHVEAGIQDAIKRDAELVALSEALKEAAQDIKNNVTNN